MSGMWSDFVDSWALFGTSYVTGWLIAASLALVALALGSALGWVIITQLFEFDWLPDWGAVLAVLGLVVALERFLGSKRAKPVLGGAQLARKGSWLSFSLLAIIVPMNRFDVVLARSFFSKGLVAVGTGKICGRNWLGFRCGFARRLGRRVALHPPSGNSRKLPSFTTMIKACNVSSDRPTGGVL